MHGIGNDFIVVNCLGELGDQVAMECRQKAVWLCDRKFGVGGDGVILVLIGQNTRFRMVMYNPDGSEAEMCGNGIRCFAKYIHDHGYTQGETDIPVETGAGLLRVQANLGSDGKVSTVRVDMGEPVLTPSLVPTTLGAGSDKVVNESLVLKDRTLHVTTVSMGNPHAVTFVDDVASYPVAQVGPQVENNSAFPKRTNTEFIQVLSEGEINFRVWERGAGETLACGTGACAAVVASALNGKTDRHVLVHLPGGDLDIDWSAQDNHVYMTGSATEVYEGEIL
jgi:diaminopimelate epimerase